MNEEELISAYNNEVYINNRLIEIMNDIESKYKEIGVLLKEFHELLGDDADATVNNSAQVKNLLNKYSDLKK